MGGLGDHASAREAVLWRELLKLRRLGFWGFRASDCPALAQLCGPPAPGERPEAPIRARLLALLDPPARGADGRVVAPIPLAQRDRMDPGLFARVLFGEAAALSFDEGGGRTLRFDSRTRSVTERYKDLAQLRHTSADTIRKAPKADEPRGGPAYRLMADLVTALASSAPAPAAPPPAAELDAPPAPDRALVVAAGLLGVALFGVILALALHGDGIAGSALRDAALREHRPSGCAVIDASNISSAEREYQLAQLTRFALEIGSDGSGRLCVVVAGQHLTADAPVVEQLWDGHTPVSVRVQRAVRATRAVIDTSGHARAAIVEAATVAARAMHRGDVLLILSDGVQNSPETGDFRTSDLSPDALVELLDVLEADGLVPDLRDVEIRMPELQVVAHGSGPPTQHQVRQIDRFWSDWAHRTGGRLALSP